jgi:hypothetical protein
LPFCAVVVAPAPDLPLPGCPLLRLVAPLIELVGVDGVVVDSAMLLLDLGVERSQIVPFDPAELAARRPDAEHRHGSVLAGNHDFAKDFGPLAGRELALKDGVVGRVDGAADADAGLPLLEAFDRGDVAFLHHVFDADQAEAAGRRIDQEPSARIVPPHRDMLATGELDGRVEVLAGAAADEGLIGFDDRLVWKFFDRGPCRTRCRGEACAQEHQAQQHAEAWHRTISWPAHQTQSSQAKTRCNAAGRGRIWSENFENGRD